MYKLVAIDLDGTLLNDRSEISEKDIDTIERLKENGYKVLFASGRRYYSVKKVLSSIKGEKTIIANNGNIIRRTKNDQTVYSNYLSYSHVKPAISDGKKMGLHPVIHIDGFKKNIDMVIELDKDAEEYHAYLDGKSRIKKLDRFSLMPKMKILSVVYLGNRQELKKFADYINETYENAYKTYLMINVESADALLEICSFDVSKWTSILRYAKNYDIKSEDIVVIGDDNNDVEMIKNAGLGIAMKNGTEEVRKVADVITEKDNNQSGLSHVLGKYFDI